MSKISVDKQKKIKEDLLSKNYWWKDSMKQLDSWIGFYYHFGRFPGSPNWTNVPHVNMPIFLKTEMPLSPLHLYKKFFWNRCKRACFKSWFSRLKYLFGWKSKSIANCFY